MLLHELLLFIQTTYIISELQHLCNYPGTQEKHSYVNLSDNSFKNNDSVYNAM